MMTAEPGASISQFAPQDVVDLFWRRHDLEALLKALQGAAGAKVVRCCSTGKVGDAAASNPHSACARSHQALSHTCSKRHAP